MGPSDPEDAVVSKGWGPLSINRSAADAVIAVALALTALWLWSGAAAIDASGESISGPRAFPRGIAALLGVSALFLLVSSAAAIFGLRTTEVATRIRVSRPPAVLATMALFVAYPLLLSRFGFYLTTGVWLLLLLFVCGWRDVLRGVGTTIGFLVFVKVVFQMMMGIPLP